MSEEETPKVVDLVWNAKDWPGHGVVMLDGKDSGLPCTRVFTVDGYGFAEFNQRTSDGKYLKDADGNLVPPGIVYGKIQFVRTSD